MSSKRSALGPNPMPWPRPTACCAPYLAQHTFGVLWAVEHVAYALQGNLRQGGGGRGEYDH